ncbi:MAG: PAS domain S-box protein [Leptolyngbyaceae cyanobacterium MAG.088]|nr:PAS domain S-box protein [Leptolyngbyaceae cyanobacterium MAG.088]
MFNIPLLGQYMPHGYCYLWRPSLVGLHLVSDTLIGLAYYSIPITLLHFLKKRRDVPFYKVFLLFAAFIVFCGTTHLFNVWTLWHSDYWVSGVLKAMTAFVSTYTALALIPVIPKALDLRSPSELEALNQQLEQEVAERRQTEVELRESSTRLNLALEAVGIGIWDWDITHNTLIWDDRLYALYGIAPEAFEGNIDIWTRCVHPEDRPAAEASLKCALRNEAIYDSEFRVIHADGTVRYLKGNALIQRDEQDKPIRMIGTDYDITDRKEAEHQLKESEERFTSLAATAPVGIFRANTEGNCIYVNEHLCEIARLTSEQMLGTGWVQALYPEDRDAILAEWHQATSQNRPFKLEYRFGSLSGPVTWVYEEAVPEFNYTNQVSGYVGCLTDITERKQAELSLQVAQDKIVQKEALFRNTFEQAAVGIVHVSPTGKLLRVNQRYCDIVGHPKTELLNLEFQVITHPEDVETNLAYFQQALAGQIKTYRMEKRYLRKDGTVTWANLTGTLVRQQTGKPDYFIGVIEDINARKKTEEMLRLYERAICTTPDHMSFVDRNYIYAMVNDVYAQKFGKSKAEIIGHSVAELLGEETFLQTVKPNLDSTFAGEEVHYQSLFSITDELQQYLDVTYTPYREADGTITGAVVSVRDISDVHAAEVALTYQARRAEALLELPHLAEQLDEQEFMQQAQNIAKTLTGSDMAFLYLVNEEQATFELMPGGQQTLTELNNAVSKTCHPIHQAGILADVLHERQAVICNCACGSAVQEQALLQEQGLLQAHEQLNRLLSVPVIENGKVVMLTGVGNKGNNYTEMDVETVQLISNLIWQTVQHYRSIQTSRLLAAVVESTDDAIITKDLNGFITSWNAGAEKLLGYSALEAIGQSIKMLFPTDRVAEAVQTLERLKQGKHIDQFETVRFHKDGTLLDLSLTISPLKDWTGQLIGDSTIMRDISARKIAEQKLNIEMRERQRVISTLQRTAKRLEESNQELQDFAYVASHDLQEPLRKVQVFGDRLNQTCQDRLPEKGQDYLNRMLSAAVRAQALINDLLSFSRVTTQAKPFTPIDLSDVMTGVLSDLEVRIEQTGATVDVDPLPTIDADRMQMQQVFQNLLSNALKFHKPGVAPQIQVRVQHYLMGEQEVCELRVIDNGIGFDVKYCDRIFQPFQRLHGRKAYEGSGIGLAICRKVIRRHEGILQAESQPGAGATFIAILPVHHSQQEKDNVPPTE